jgi:hypothetical protein
LQKFEKIFRKAHGDLLTKWLRRKRQQKRLPRSTEKRRRDNFSPEKRPAFRGVFNLTGIDFSFS